MISKEVLLESLDLSGKIIQKWLQQVEAGIPGVTVPADEGEDLMLLEFCNEMVHVAKILESMSDITMVGHIDR